MAASREPRCNAGNRMSRVLEEELEEDDFYKTTYGGFADEEEDGDFQHDQEDSADEVDSDFDRSEDDEIKSEEEAADKPKPRRKGVSTKAYKEPSVKKPKLASDSKPETASDSVQTKKRTHGVNNNGPMRKSSRKSTATNSLMTIIRQKERESDKKKKEITRKPATGVRRLTQEELMKLAEKTERKNLKSLEKYQRLEANRKKVAVKKKTFEGPTVKFMSMAVPILDKSNSSSEASETPKRDTKLLNTDKMSRNFVVFSHDSTFDETFNYKRKRPPSTRYCPVTRQPARYIDPVTKIPYYDMTAFKIIRRVYHETLQEMKSK